MEITAWLAAHGVPAVVIAVLVIIAPYVLALLREQIALVREQRLRELLLALVRAAEQIFGAQADAADDKAATNLGNTKLDYVLETAMDRGMKVDLPDVEAAVHEVKGKGGCVGKAVLGTTEAVKL